MRDTGPAPPRPTRRPLDDLGDPLRQLEAELLADRQRLAETVFFSVLDFLDSRGRPRTGYERAQIALRCARVWLLKSASARWPVDVPASLGVSRSTIERCEVLVLDAVCAAVNAGQLPDPAPVPRHVVEAARPVLAVAA